MKSFQSLLLDDDAAIDRLIDAMAPLSGVQVDPAYREGIKTHLKAVAGAAKQVLGFDLEDESEPGPVFRP